PDSVPRYLGGYVVAGTQLLQTIQTFLDGQLVMTYSFNSINDNRYPQGTATGRSRLVSVTAADASGDALPSTVFTYQDGDAGIFPPPTLGLTLDAATTAGLIPADVNGDGRVDLVQFVANAAGRADAYLQINLYLSDGTGFSGPLEFPFYEIPFGSDIQLL